MKINDRNKIKRESFVSIHQIFPAFISLGENKAKQKKQAGLLRNIYVSQLCNVTIIRIIITEKCHQPKDRH